ncbi:MAG: hypothetical protein CMJ64_09865 [Planctomycetaceae bacterium]|nr:hypothetical protein [Planctomycetaceae bacterium]
MATKLTRKKPSKPHPDFPLTANGNGQWSKKIRGKVYYFGPWAEHQAALDRYLNVKDDLLAGRKLRWNLDDPCVVDVVNHFLTAKNALVESGELTHRSWKDYKQTCERVIEVFDRHRLIDDLGADDFLQLREKLTEGRNPVSLGNEIQRVRTLFKYAYDAELIDRPVRFGPTFKRPGKKVRRRLRNDQGPKLFAAEEVRAMLETDSLQLRAMILLAINCGFGNTDCATLPRTRLDLVAGWHRYGRPKTGVERRCPLWVETVAALKEVAKTRPTPRDARDIDLVFMTKYGNRWIRQPNAASDAWIDSVSLEFGKIVASLGIARPGATFYSLRRTFRTVADATRDQPAVMHIMGHADADNDMSAVYRQGIDDDRLVAVVNHVHEWLFPKKERPAKST